VLNEVVVICHVIICHRRQSSAHKLSTPSHSYNVVALLRCCVVALLRCGLVVLLRCCVVVVRSCTAICWSVGWHNVVCCCVVVDWRTTHDVDVLLQGQATHLTAYSMQKPITLTQCTRDTCD